MFAYATDPLLVTNRPRGLPISSLDVSECFRIVLFDVDAQKIETPDHILSSNRLKVSGRTLVGGRKWEPIFSNTVDTAQPLTHSKANSTVIC